MNIIDIKKLDDNFFKYKEFVGIDTVNQIINDVKASGDNSIKKYSKKFGDGELDSFEITEEEIETALSEVPSDILKSIEYAIKNVKKFAQAQLSNLKDIEISFDGITLGHKVIPIERIGAYVPGGNYPLPSSAIMSVVPAKIAGVKEAIVCSPKVKPVTIAACKVAGADKIFKIGGVQAVAAMAYGTETIPKVDKIVGPGNKFVTAAKKEVYGICGIDFLAGPSEVLIIADDSSNADFIAADLLAQAEHDKDAEAYLITTSRKLANKVLEKIDEYLKVLETSDIASESIKNGCIIITENIDQAIEISNKKAPEHLEICFENAQDYTDKFKNYGSLFIGNYSAEVFGDYCSGTNHILPTNSISRYTGGLSVFDFVKIQTYQNISKKASQDYLSPNASNLAKTEGLFAHKLSADLRCKF